MVPTGICGNCCAAIVPVASEAARGHQACVACADDDMGSGWGEPYSSLSAALVSSFGSGTAAALRRLSKARLLSRFIAVTGTRRSVCYRRPSNTVGLVSCLLSAAAYK
jgi:hypothetical protein